MSYRLMIYDADALRAETFTAHLKTQGYTAVCVSALSELCARAAKSAPDAALLFIDIPDAAAFDEIALLSPDVPVVVFSTDGRTEQIRAAIQAGVASYVVDGFRPERIPPVLETAIARHREIRALKQELQTARTDLADRKLIDRAKGLIMAQRNCTESEAYHLLRKMAMNQKKRLADMAHDVVAIGEALAS